MSYDGANLAEGLISQVERGESPYAKGPCGAGEAGYQVRALFWLHRFTWVMGLLAQSDPGGPLCMPPPNPSPNNIGPPPHPTSPSNATHPQVAVALMHRFQVTSAQPPSDTAAAFAGALHDAWGVGSAACDNGVLLLLSTRDRQMYISTGPAAAAAGLDGAAIQEVLSNMKRPLREGRYDDAVLEAVHEIGLVLAGAAVPGGGGGGSDAEEEDGWGIFLFFSSIVGGMFGWGWWSNRRRTQRFKVSCGGLRGLYRSSGVGGCVSASRSVVAVKRLARCSTCPHSHSHIHTHSHPRTLPTHPTIPSHQMVQNKLEALKRDQAALRRGQYQATSCPICLEDFEGEQQQQQEEEGAGAGAGGGGAGSSATDAATGASSSKKSGDAAAATSNAKAAADSSRETAPLLAQLAEAGHDASTAAAAAAGGGGMGAAPTSPKPKRKPLVLRCGHSFCAPCIGEWVKGHTTCPVCRRDLDAADGDEAASSSAARSRPPCSATAAAAQQQQQQPERRRQADLWLPELMFRTRRLGLLYPDLVSDTMTAQFLDDIQSGRDLSESALRHFDARHPARDATRRQELRDSGRMGAGVSFGGGHSGGGGGGGSSW